MLKSHKFGIGIRTIVLYDKNLETLVAYPAGKKDETVVLPDTVKTIGKLAMVAINL